MFEYNVAEYTGAKYAVSCDNCTNAIRMCCELYDPVEVEIPAKTYLSVPQSIIQAGHKVKFNHERNKWLGAYKLEGLPIYDSAKRLTSDMYIPNTLMCLSFGIKKPLKLGKGGMILTDSYEHYEILKKKRWSGRTEMVNIHEDKLPFMGYNSYITPELAAWGMMMLSVYPKHAADAENEDYPDCSKYEIFK
tara:strand:- start:974 stop:1546 length:573 start_codon:yes stop_codon:yes gene_type:complete